MRRRGFTVFSIYHMHQFCFHWVAYLFSLPKMGFNRRMKHKTEQEKSGIVKLRLSGMSVVELSQKYRNEELDKRLQKASQAVTERTK